MHPFLAEYACATDEPEAAPPNLGQWQWEFDATPSRTRLAGIMVAEMVAIRKVAADAAVAAAAAAGNGVATSTAIPKAAVLRHS